MMIPDSFTDDDSTLPALRLNGSLAFDDQIDCQYLVLND